MLAARVRATTDLHTHLPNLRITVIGNSLRNCRRQVHRFGQSQIARVSARAGDRIGNLVRAGIRQIDGLQRRVHSTQIVDWNPRDHQILVDPHSHIAVAGIPSDLRRGAHLRAHHVTLRTTNRHNRIAGVLLFLHVRFQPPIKRRVGRGRTQHR